MGTVLHARIEVLTAGSVRWWNVAVFDCGKDYAAMRILSDNTPITPTTRSLVCTPACNPKAGHAADCERLVLGAELVSGKPGLVREGWPEDTDLDWDDSWNDYPDKDGSTEKTVNDYELAQWLTPEDLELIVADAAEEDRAGTWAPFAMVLAAAKVAAGKWKNENVRVLFHRT